MASALSALAIGPVHAQDRARDLDYRHMTVAERAEAFGGVQLGSFIFRPSLELQEWYDSNVFANATDRSDWITVLRPEFTLKSTWSRHSLKAGAAAEVVHYARFDSENTVNATARVEGVFEVLSDLSIAADAEVIRGTEQRGTGDSFANYDEPVRYTSSEVGVSINKRFNRLFASVGFANRWRDFEDTTIGGVNVDQDFRDETRYAVTARVGYEISPLTSVFVETAYNNADHPGAQFDSTGYKIVGGVSFEPTHLMKGELTAGYLAQNYRAPLDDVSTWTVGGKLAWFVTPLMTVTFAADREAGISSFAGGSSRVETTVSAAVDYELRRDLLLHTKLTYEVDDFEGVSRTDDAITFGLGATYMLNRWFSAGIDYKYTNFNSDGAGIVDYDRHFVGLRLTGKL